MDKERLSHLTQGGDGEAAEAFLRQALRSGDLQGQIDAAFGLLVDCTGTEDFAKGKEMFHRLLALEAYEEAFCWFPDEVSRLEELAQCPKCEGSGESPEGRRRRRGSYASSCKKCDGFKYLPLDEAAEVAILLGKFPRRVGDHNLLFSLYLRCLMIWWPVGWEDWFHRYGPGKLSRVAQWAHLVGTRDFHPKSSDLSLPEVPSCICGGNGGCSFCKNSCPSCGISLGEYRSMSPREHRNRDYPDCHGSRNGYCRGGGCDYCYDNDICPRCRKEGGTK